MIIPFTQSWTLHAINKLVSRGDDYLIRSVLVPPSGECFLSKGRQHQHHWVILLDMKILVVIPGLRKLQRWGPAICVVTSPLSDSDSPSSLRITGLISPYTKIKWKVLIRFIDEPKLSISNFGKQLISLHSGSKYLYLENSIRSHLLTYSCTFNTWWTSNESQPLKYQRSTPVFALDHPSSKGRPDTGRKQNVL